MAATVANVLYLHGLNSAPQSVKASLLGAAIDALPVEMRPHFTVPALDHRPAKAMRDVCAWIDAHRSGELTLVGSSLGGFYATCLAERYAARAVLINPSVRPFDDLERYLGTQRNPYSGATWELTRAHFAELRAFAVDAITRPERYWLMVQSGDEVLDWRVAVAYYAGAWQLVQGGGDHSFQQFAAQIPPLLRFAGVDGVLAS
ncbi:MAG TPA: YqiA/YcfP family alpha/beta fold hydrolase [Casimicrobiaceae bacterium]